MILIPVEFKSTGTSLELAPDDQCCTNHLILYPRLFYLIKTKQKNPHIPDANLRVLIPATKEPKSMPENKVKPSREDELTIGELENNRTTRRRSRSRRAWRHLPLRSPASTGLPSTSGAISGAAGSVVAHGSWKNRHRLVRRGRGGFSTERVGLHTTTDQWSGTSRRQTRPS